MSKGIVYILTNPCLDGWVKLGMTKRNEPTGLAKKILKDTEGRPESIALNGWQYFVKDWLTLSEMRDRIEHAQHVDDEY